MTAATKTLDISKALAIPGWMTEPELWWLAEQARSHSRIVEIGSYKGRSTRALGDNLKLDGFVLAIDSWRGSPEMSVEERAGLFKAFHTNCADLIASAVVLPITCDHGSIPVDWTQIEPDMVFIDGAHDYDSVRRDVELWMGIVPSGLLCGHDFYYEPVARAVRDVLGQVGAVAVVPGTSIWCKL